jgi:DNA repair photolyase
MPHPTRGRGALSQPSGRFNQSQTLAVDDGWYQEASDVSPATHVSPDRARTVITRNDSPDLPFDRTINPYRGCEHGCIYCYARPSHAYLGLSPGLDFETRLFAKHDAAQLLARELAAPGYVPKPILLGANTDAYQPIEKRLQITRAVLEVLARTRHPVSLITKAALIVRDLDLLQELARHRLVRVMITLPTLDANTKRVLEPRAAGPEARLRVIETLARAGVQVGVMIAPVIPALTDHELESILERAAASGAERAAYTLLRLPYEVKDLFREWLAAHYPDRAQHVMSLVRAMRNGRDNDPCFGSRMRGAGPFADLLHARFTLACKRLGLAHDRGLGDLNVGAFAPPPRATARSGASADQLLLPI